MGNDTITISRGLTEHWLWQDAELLRWWLDLVFMAASKATDVLVGYKVCHLRRGQLLVSVRSLQDRWAKRDRRGKIIEKPTERRILNFLRLLQDENMVMREICRQRQNTVLTICDYGSYASSENFDTPPATPKHGVNYL